jgi:SAM-dependent methyltransferase
MAPYNRRVESRIERLLLELNREFYQSLAEPFADSRPKPQPGVDKELIRVQPEQSVLDLGCGHGALVLHGQGHRGPYLGLDSTPALLAQAQASVEHQAARFEQVDLAEPGWSEAVEKVDWVFCLATLHHLPGTRRRAWAGELPVCLRPETQVVVSVWNFVAEERWRQRVQAWSEVGLEDGQVDVGDYLLDWRRGGRGLRYVHHFNEDELAELATAAGCQVTATHYAGGRSGRLNLIQRWQTAVL